MEVKQFVDTVNKLRLANRGKWYWFRDDFVFSRDIEKGELTIGQFKIRF